MKNLVQKIVANKNSQFCERNLKLYKDQSKIQKLCYAINVIAAIINKLPKV